MIEGAVNINAGMPFTKIDGGTTWENVDKIFDTQAMGEDVANIFNVNAWDFDSYSFLGYVGDVPQGWSYTHIDTDDTWEPITEPNPIASFTTAKGENVLVVLQQRVVDEDVTSFSVSGQVLDTTKTATWSIDTETQTAPIMNPFPVATTLADIEKFAKPGDLIYVFSPLYYDFETYQFVSAGEWSVQLYDPEQWVLADPITVTDTSTVILPAGVGGYFQQEPDAVSGEYTGRVWEVTIGK